MLHESTTDGQWSLELTNGIMPGPVFYIMAVEQGNWRAAARACIIMIRSDVNADAWRLRLKEVLRARHRNKGAIPQDIRGNEGTGSVAVSLLPRASGS